MASCQTKKLPTPPLTPRISTHESCTNTPPAHKRGPIPEFLKALRQDSVDRVREVLHANPDAIWCPPLDYSVDPPLCVAIELGCSPAVIKLLLDRGADVTAESVQGHTPLSLLKDQTHQLLQDPQHIRDITMMLEMAMPPTYSSKAIALQVSAAKYEDKENVSNNHNVLRATDFRAGSGVKGDCSSFTEMLPQFPPVLDLRKPNLHEKLDDLLLAAWCSKDDYSCFAEIPPQVKPVLEMPKVDLHGNFDGVLYGTWYAKEDAKFPLNFPPVPDLSKLDLNEKLDGLFFDADLSW